MMSTPIIDPLALWGIQNISQAQTLALIRAAPDLLAALLHIAVELSNHPDCADAETADTDLAMLGNVDKGFLIHLLRTAEDAIHRAEAA